MTQIIQLIRLVVFLVLVATGTSLGQNSGLCPEGLNERTNAGRLGCSVCSEPTDCEIVCVDQGTCLPGCVGEECCADNPCCDGCPDAGSAECSVLICACDPPDCCSIACPSRMAPTVSPAVLTLIAAILALVGIVLLRRRSSP